MRLHTLPGVFRPRSDSWALAEAVAREVVPGDRLIDLCTGSGVVAIQGALAGARVLAVDISRRAVLTAVANARANGVRITGRRGDLLAVLHPGQRVDVITANPPYVPGRTDRPRGAARAWEGGPDGRAVLDRIIRDAPAHLADGGRLLVTHSSLCGEDATHELMTDVGLVASTLVRSRGPLGPIVQGRRAQLEQSGVLAPGEAEEDIVVIRGTRRV